MSEGEDRSKGPWWKPLVIVGMGGGLIITIVFSALALSTGPAPVAAQPLAAAMPEITPADVFVRQPLPSGDNKTANIPIEIEMINVGKGKSGSLLVWCGAFDHAQPNLLLDDFSTSSLKTMSDYSLTGRIAPAGKPGSIVRLSGELQLPTGEYDLRLRIYEDGGNRTLVSGLIRIIVDKNSVKVPDPFTPEGSTGRSYTDKAPSAGLKSTPGFEALGALAAAGIALVVIMGKRRAKTDR